MLFRSDTVVLDKTGTITQGMPVVTDVLCPAMDRREFLRGAASLESRSEHPLAAAVTARAEAEGWACSQPRWAAVICCG